MRAVLLAATLLAPLLAAAAGGENPVVHVRIEGGYAQLWSGTVALPATYTFVAEGGRTHTLDARTPLGALHAAAQAAGLELTIRDEYDDFEAVSVGGEYWWDVKWWDFRVDWVQTNYGPQEQWLDARGALPAGAEVLWYVEQPGSIPLRLAPLAPAQGLGPLCAQPVLAETLLLDPLHQAGQAWPQLTWRPAPLSRLDGPAGNEQPTPAGVGAALALTPGWVWGEEMPLPVGLLHHYIRSARLWLDCTI